MKLNKKRESHERFIWFFFNSLHSQNWQFSCWSTLSRKSKNGFGSFWLVVYLREEGSQAQEGIQSDSVRSLRRGNVSPVTSSAWQMHFYSRSFSIRSNIIKESNVCSKVSRWHVRYHRHGIKRQLFSWMVHLIRITMVRFLFLSKRRRIQFIASLIIGLRKSMSMGENGLNSQGNMDFVSQQF